jgi:hypothetical protein
MKPFFINWEMYYNTITATFGFGFLHEVGQPALRWDNYYGPKYDEIKSFFDELDSLDTVSVTNNWLSEFDNWVIQAQASSYDDIPDEDQSSIHLIDFVPSTNNPITRECNVDSSEYALCTTLSP